MNLSFWRRYLRGENGTRVPPLVISEKDNLPYVLEQIKGLRARCEQRMQSRNLRVLAVTSAVAGEGKTFSAANLAVSLAVGGKKRVLLLDFDIRNSDLAKDMGIVPSPGLSEFLSGTAQMRDVVRNSLYERLHVIPSGTKVADPAKILTGSSVEQVLKYLREYFDCIIVDTPPVLPVSDTLILREHVDGFILVVRSDFTPFGLIKKASEEIGESNILGVVINGAPAEGVRYYKRYYGKYYRPSPRKDDDHV